MITDQQLAKLLSVRVQAPQTIASRWEARSRRPLVGDDNTMFLVAADHPARGALAVGSDPMAMANRVDLLQRLATALTHPGVDGVLASAEILDDLLLLGYLENKLAIGTMNRGGLAGSVWELDDPMTGYTVAGVKRFGLDGAKMLLRIDDTDAGSLRTIEICAEAVEELGANQLMAMVEPLPYKNGGLDTDDEKQIRAVAIASGLGSTSAYTWLKLPATGDVERMMSATTLPSLLLGGVPGPDPETAFDGWQRSLAVPHVHGLVIGRSLLYPADGNVAAAIDRAARIVHPAI